MKLDDVFHVLREDLGREVRVIVAVVKVQFKTN